MSGNVIKVVYVDGISGAVLHRYADGLIKFMGLRWHEEANPAFQAALETGHIKKIEPPEQSVLDGLDGLELTGAYGHPSKSELFLDRGIVCTATHDHEGAGYGSLFWLLKLSDKKA